MSVFDPETGEEIFCHPETNERLETHEDVIAALVWVEEKMAPFYRVRRNLRDFQARTYAPAALPSRRNRTDKQALIARCPRCGGRIENED